MPCLKQLKLLITFGYGSNDLTNILLLNASLIGFLTYFLGLHELSSISTIVLSNRWGDCCSFSYFKSVSST